MDVNLCPQCGKHMIAVATRDGRTGLQCSKCDRIDSVKADVVKRAESPLAKPEAA